MGLSSVNIDALATLTDVVRRAHDEILADQQLITTTLDGGPVDTSGLSKLTAHATWFQDQGALLKNQLGYARWLEASTPGIQGTVKFDQGALPNLDYDTAKPLADKVKALMDEGPPPSQELLDLMKKYGGDPTFALLALNGFRKGDGYATMDAPPAPDLSYLKELGDSPGAQQFLTLYSQMLGGLTSEFPPTPMLQGSDPSDYRAMALLASRDSWDASWLTQLGNDIIKAERDDPDMWTKTLDGVPQSGHYDTIPSVVTPEGIEMRDPMVWLMDALSRNPDAAADLFNGGGDASIKSNGDQVDIGANLRWLTLERPWLQDSGLSLALALAAAKQSGDTAFAGDLEALQHLDKVEKQSWLSFLGHLGLDVVGLVPFVGDFADALNIAWYVGENDFKNAGLATAGAVPVFGSSATLAKWIKILNNTADVTGKILDAEQLKQMLEDLPYTDQKPGQAPGTGPAPGGRPVGPGAVFLGDADGKPWYEGRHGLQKTQVYVTGGGAVVFETDGQGRISEIHGDTGSLSAQEQAWIRKHSAPER